VSSLWICVSASLTYATVTSHAIERELNTLIITQNNLSKSTQELFEQEFFNPSNYKEVSEETKNYSDQVSQLESELDLANDIEQEFFNNLLDLDAELAKIAEQRIKDVNAELDKFIGEQRVQQVKNLANELEILSDIEEEELNNLLELEAELQKVNEIREKGLTLNLGEQISEIQTITGAINGMSSAILAAVTASQQFGENWAKDAAVILNVISQLINQYLALMAAGVIAAESSKGLLGLATAAAAIAGFLAIVSPFIDRNASGGIIGGRGSGLSLVGETGAELIAAPVGTQVYNPFMSQRMLQNAFSGGQVKFVIERDTLTGILGTAKIENNVF
jgi:hypothetical protein